MTSDAIEYVAYSPPKSVSFGHVARFRDARKAWLATQSFLERHTRFRIAYPAELIVYGPDYGVEGEVAADRFSEAIDVFGPATDGAWSVAEVNLDRAIAFALDDDCWSKQPIGPSQLSFAVAFSWAALQQVDRDDHIAVNMKSDVIISIGMHRVFIQPSLLIPAPFDSPITLGFLQAIEADLPFRLRDQYFKRLLPSPKGGHRRSLRLPKNWRAA
jgi:hypothetical protein